MAVLQGYHSVAPHAGAWIETYFGESTKVASRVAPHAGAWIETLQRLYTIAVERVAPHAGAWIETYASVWSCNRSARSRPTRARGLKLTWLVRKRQEAEWSRPTRARGLKRLCRLSMLLRGKSRPTRARGLKQILPRREDSRIGHVAPHAGAWIETLSSPPKLRLDT